MMSERALIFKEGIYTQKELNEFLRYYSLPQVAELRDGLAAQKYFCNNVLSLKILIEYELRERALMFSGDAGAGKTSLALALARHYQKKLYRLDCYKGINEQRALYAFNHTLQSVKIQRLFENDPNPSDEKLSQTLYDYSNITFGPLGKAFTDDNEDCFILINEIDKIPPEEGFEATLLTYLDEKKFIIAELNLEVTPRTKRHPLFIITSNAGTQHGGSAIGSEAGDGVKMLSYPLQRRGIHLHLKSPNMPRMYQIIKDLCPNLHLNTVREIILFVAHLGFFRNSTDSSIRDLPIQLAFSRLEKPIGTSEIIDWARALEWLYLQYKDIPELDNRKLLPVFVALTCERLVKTESDQNQIIATLTDAIHQVQKSNWDAEAALETLISEDVGEENQA